MTITCSVCGNPVDSSFSRCPICGAKLEKPAAGKKKKSELIRTVNLEEGMPDREQARERMRAEIASAKRDGVRVLKLIHGYGSSGEGGVLRLALRTSLGKMEKSGELLRFVAGEEFDGFSQYGAWLVKRYPELRDDPDFNRRNPGITLVALR